MKRKSAGKKLSQMSERAATRIKRLPKRECALWKSPLCIGEIECLGCRIERGQECGYFERAVLPLEKGGKEIYAKMQKGKE